MTAQVFYEAINLPLEVWRDLNVRGEMLRVYTIYSMHYLTTPFTRYYAHYMNMR